MKLYDEHLHAGQTGIQHDRVKDIIDNLWRPEYKEFHVMPSSSSDAAYLVAKVSVLDGIEFEAADVVEDRVEMWVCSCDDFQYRRSNGLQSAERIPSEVDECKHITDVTKVKRAQNDDNQTEL